MKFVDRCKGVPDPPNGRRHANEILFYSEYRTWDHSVQKASNAWLWIRTLGKECPQ